MSEEELANEAIRENYEATIASMLASVGQDDQGQITLAAATAEELGVDAEAFQQITASIAQLNEDIASGEIIAAAVRMPSPEGEAHA